jgi:hypothetical protein
MPSRTFILIRLQPLRSSPEEAWFLVRGGIVFSSVMFLGLRSRKKQQLIQAPEARHDLYLFMFYCVPTAGWSRSLDLR